MAVGKECPKFQFDRESGERPELARTVFRSGFPQITMLRSPSFPSISLPVFSIHSDMRILQTNHSSPSVLVEAVARMMEEIQGYIQSGDIIIFGKSYCPFTKRVVEQYRIKGLKYEVIYIDREDNYVEYDEILFSLSQMSTSPIVYYKSRLIGGCDAALHLLY